MGIRERVRYEDITGVRVGRFGGRVNTTAFVWRVGSTIIDTGPPNQWPSVREFAAAAPVDQVVVSHHHEDHAGNLARFQATGVARVLAPRESLGFLEHGFPLQLYRRIVWGRPRNVRVQAFVSPIDVGVRTLEPILVTGHAPDMTCLLDRERGVLFGADLYIGRALRYLRQDENLNGIIAGLERVLDIDFDTLLCSHRGIVQPAREKLREKLEYLQDLRANARALAAEGLDVGGITRQLLGSEDSISRLSFGHFSKANLVRACLNADGSTGSMSSP